tara:strand:- start:3967 stop:4533 length:567 start_codon:yes stop_codon:yes gene_type:complete
MSRENMDISFLSDVLKTKGVALEIGGGEGNNTRVFCQLPIFTGVVVVDPFELCWEDGDIDEGYVKPYPYKKWAMTVLPFLKSKRLVHIPKRSDDPTLVNNLINATPIVFAFLDGLQTEENLLHELRLMETLGVEVICLDDWGRVSDVCQVESAANKFLSESNTYKLHEVRDYSGNSNSGIKIGILTRK